MVVLAWRNLLRASHTSVKTLMVCVHPELQALTACCSHWILEAYVFWPGDGGAETR